MNLKFQVAPTRVFTKPYEPTSLEIWIGSTDTIPAVAYQAAIAYQAATEETPEILAQPEVLAAPEKNLVNIETETVEILENGRRLEKRTFKMPAEYLAQAIGGYDLITGKAIINIQALNYILQQFEIEII